MRKTKEQPDDEAVVISREPALLPEAGAPPLGVRSRASLRTYGPIGVRYEIPEPAVPVNTEEA